MEALLGTSVSPCVQGVMELLLQQAGTSIAYLDARAVATRAIELMHAQVRAASSELDPNEFAADLVFAPYRQRCSFLLQMQPRNRSHRVVPAPSTSSRKRFLHRSAFQRKAGHHRNDIRGATGHVRPVPMEAAGPFRMASAPSVRDQTVPTEASRLLRARSQGDHPHPGLNGSLEIQEYYEWRRWQRTVLQVQVDETPNNLVHALRRFVLDEGVDAGKLRRLLLEREEMGTLLARGVEQLSQLFSELRVVCRPDARVPLIGCKILRFLPRCARVHPEVRDMLEKAVRLCLASDIRDPIMCLLVMKLCTMPHMLDDVALLVETNVLQCLQRILQWDSQEFKLSHFETTLVQAAWEVIHKSAKRV
jgi:hypothetical protein